MVKGGNKPGHLAVGRAQRYELPCLDSVVFNVNDGERMVQQLLITLVVQCLNDAGGELKVAVLLSCQKPGDGVCVKRALRPLELERDFQHWFLLPGDDVGAAGPANSLRLGLTAGRGTPCTRAEGVLHPRRPVAQAARGHVTGRAFVLRRGRNERGASVAGSSLGVLSVLVPLVQVRAPTMLSLSSARLPGQLPIRL